MPEYPIPIGYIQYNTITGSYCVTQFPFYDKWSESIDHDSYFRKIFGAGLAIGRALEASVTPNSFPDHNKMTLKIEGNLTKVENFILTLYDEIPLILKEIIVSQKTETGEVDYILKDNYCEIILNYWMKEKGVTEEYFEQYEIDEVSCVLNFDRKLNVRRKYIRNVKEHREQLRKHIEKFITGNAQDE
jgi:hypothetical protein